MRSIVLGSALVASLALGEAAPSTSPAPAAAVAGEAPKSAPASPDACPPATLPDDDVCVHVPTSTDSAPGSDAEPNAHFDRRGRWVVYDQIPRRPDRPSNYDAYRYPVPCSRDCVVSGYDLDRPDESQRRGRHLTFVGHGGVDLVQPRGTPIGFVPLDHQEGDAEVVYVGPLYGTTVLARSTVREGGRLRDYILLFGHLEAPAAGLAPHTAMKGGDLVGTVGDTGSPELVHLHLEARRLREGVDLFKLGPTAIMANENSVVCDPRNVLPLR